jgi:hypothetical protein
MKSLTGLATISLIIFAAASASAQTTPGTPSKPNTVTSVPAPPPPPGGPDKVATQTRPFGPGTPKRRGPSAYDDFAGGPGGSASTCHTALDDKFQACVDSLTTKCDKDGGGMRTNENGSVTCVPPPN